MLKQLSIIFCAIACLFTSSAYADYALGSPSAPVTIIEYGSLTCDYCVRFHRDVLPLIESRHIETGNVRFIYRDFPTSVTALQGAVAAQCSGSNQYYMMLNSLFRTVGDWALAKDVNLALIELASSLGLNKEAFKTCLEDPLQSQIIENERDQAIFEHDVTGTPTFLINDKLVRGIKNIDEIEILIQDALNHAKQSDINEGKE